MTPRKHVLSPVHNGEAATPFSCRPVPPTSPTARCDSRGLSRMRSSLTGNSKGTRESERKESRREIAVRRNSEANVRRRHCRACRKYLTVSISHRDHRDSFWNVWNEIPVSAVRGDTGRTSLIAGASSFSADSPRSSHLFTGREDDAEPWKDIRRDVPSATSKRTRKLRVSNVLEPRDRRVVSR